MKTCSVLNRELRELRPFKGPQLPTTSWLEFAIFHDSIQHNNIERADQTGRIRSGRCVRVLPNFEVVWPAQVFLISSMDQMSLKICSLIQATNLKLITSFMEYHI